MLRSTIRSATLPHLSSSVSRTASRYSTTPPTTSTPKKDDRPQPQPTTEAAPKSKAKPKTSAEADAELMRRLEDMSGEGGAAGVEFEDGKPTSMKRSVKNNMFRYI